MKIFFFLLLGLCSLRSRSQSNLLLNGGFEDINVCTEYAAECGVEAWFYLKDVKVQMQENETGNPKLGSNSYALFYKWDAYTDFTPVIGTILPCSLQKGKQYRFRGMLSAKLNPKLIYKPGVCIGEFFYVPGRPFANKLQPDSILSLTKVPGMIYYQFEYDFIASGNERYLTFGSFVQEDELSKGRKLASPQTISIIIDNFELIPADKNESVCENWLSNKELIYAYNYRHREMDYSLYGKGELAISFPKKDSGSVTKLNPPPAVIVTDTLKLGDVLFDFNKANLKPGAVSMLTGYFINGKNKNKIDSISIEGHTDSIGTDKRNLELSKQRSESVRSWLLLNQIVTLENSSTLAFGRSRPVASNKTAAGRALNRRVEIIIFRKREE